MQDIFLISVYADASDSCNMLNFQLGNTGIGTTVPTRQWNIKVHFTGPQLQYMSTVFPVFHIVVVGYHFTYNSVLKFEIYFIH